MRKAVVLLALNIAIVSSFPTGPPNGMPPCMNLIPAPPPNSPHLQQEGNGTYDITTNVPMSSTTGYFRYTAGTQYTVTITADSGNAILGFLVQAWDPSDTRVGSFTPGVGMQLLNCSAFGIPAEATITHSQRNTNAQVMLTWTAPSGGDGMVDFRFTIVRQQTMYFGPLSAALPYGLLPTEAPTTMSQSTQGTTAGAGVASLSILLGVLMASVSVFLRA